MGLWEERWKRKIRKKRVPFTEQLAVTYRCNLKCVHCYPHLERKRNLSIVQVKEILNNLAEKGCLFIDFTGGEPLTRKDFFQIVKIARERSFSLILETNGTLITPLVADRITESNFWLVYVTLLGANPDTHDRLTGVKGSFKRSVSAIKLLKERGVRVVIQSAVMEENRKEVKNIRVMARDMGINTVSIYQKRDLNVTT